MFSTNFNDQSQSMMGSSGIPKPKSLFSSFLLSSGFSFHEQQQKEQDFHQPTRPQQPLTLQSNLLPPSLLGEGLHNMGSPRSRTVTDDATSSNEASRTYSSLLLPPSRTWSIASGDGLKSLPKVPSHFPPFDPNCTALVTDAPPSIVLVRISECLRRRSIAAEYDDESVTAKCMTVDRVHFQIQLYRSPSRELDAEETDLAPPHDAVIVEVRKYAGGSAMSFHAACSKILLAAKGLDTGDDERPPHRRNGIEFKPRSIYKRRHPSTVSSSRTFKRRRLVTLNDTQGGHSSGDRSSIAEQSLEGALALLQKDRMECQQLGMERLVNLTNMDSVGKELCHYVSRRLLLQQQQPYYSDEEDGIEASPRKWKLIDCLMHPGAKQALGPVPDERPPINLSPSKNESKHDRMVRSFLESPALTAVTPTSRKPSHDRHHSFSSSLARGASFLKKRSLRRAVSADADLHNTHPNDEMSPEELRHEAKLRSLALRVFCNALDNLSKTKELPDILHPSLDDTQRVVHTDSGSRLPSRWVKPAFLLSLVQDLQGAGRPPSVSETGYKLASVHEAALAARCLRLLAGYTADEGETESDEEEECTHKRVAEAAASCGEAQDAVRDFLRSDAVLERLDYARSCGRATHAILQYEAELTYNKLTEDDRSC